MKVAASRIRSYREPRGIIGKIVQFPLLRTIIGIAFVVIPLLVLKAILDFLLGFTSEPWTGYLRDISGVARFALAIIMYRLFTRAVEKRSADELSFSGSVRETGLGFLLGSAMMALIVAILWVFSYYRVDSFGHFSIVIHAFFFFAFAAFMEELVFRGLLFRHVEELTGTWGAVIVSGVLFGALHHGNPNATLWTSMSTAIAGVLLAGVFAYTRRIWLVWGLHTGWNYFQNAIFGSAVSGASDFDSLVRPSISGPDYLTGGAFGVEGSFMTPLLCLAVGIVYLAKAYRLGNVLGPLWVYEIRRAGVMSQNEPERKE